MEWRSDKMRLDKIRNPSLPSTNMKISYSRAVGQISRSAWHGLHPKQVICLASRKAFAFLVLKDSRNTGLVVTYTPSCTERPIETPWQGWRRRRTWGFFPGWKLELCQVLRCILSTFFLQLGVVVALAKASDWRGAQTPPVRLGL